MKLEQLAVAIEARIDPANRSTLEITGVAGIEQAGAGELTFVANQKYAALAQTTKATAVIVAEDFPAISATMLRSKNPYLSFAKAMQVFHPAQKHAPGVHPTAVIHATARIDELHTSAPTS